MLFLSHRYFFPETTAECAVKAGLRATIGICIIEFPSNYAKNPEDYLEKGLATATRFKNEPLLRCVMLYYLLCAFLPQSHAIPRCVLCAFAVSPWPLTRRIPCRTPTSPWYAI